MQYTCSWSPKDEFMWFWCYFSGESISSSFSTLLFQEIFQQPLLITTSLTSECCLLSTKYNLHTWGGLQTSSSLALCTTHCNKHQHWALLSVSHADISISSNHCCVDRAASIGLNCTMNQQTREQTCSDKLEIQTWFTVEEVCVKK